MEIINLNLIPTGTRPVVHASQYDNGRQFRANLFEGASVYTLTGAETLTFSVRKPDGHIVTEAVTNTSDNYVVIETTTQMCACAGDSFAELKIENGDDLIGTLNLILAVEQSPEEGGDPSESFIHNLEEQIADAVADQYDADSVIFDNTPTADHGVGFAVTSEGLLSYIPKTVAALDDVTITTPVQGEALVFDADGNLVNGTVSTVGSIDDLNDVDTTGKVDGDSLRYDSGSGDWIAQPTTVACTQAEYDALALSGDLVPNTHYVITDAQNLNPTASDIEYSSGVTVADKLDDLKAVATSGEYADLLNKPLTFGGVLTDLNNVSRTTLSFTLYAFNGGATNSPSGSAGGWLLSMINDNTTNYGSQIASTNGGLFFRKLVGGTFQAWTTLAT